MAGSTFDRLLGGTGFGGISANRVLAESTGDRTSGLSGGATGEGGVFQILASGSGQTTSESYVTLATMNIAGGEMQAGDRYFVLTQWHEVTAGDFDGILEISGTGITTGTLSGIMGNTGGSVSVNGHQMAWITQHPVTNDLGMADGIRSLNSPNSIEPLARTAHDTNLANWITQPHTLKVQMRCQGAGQEIAMSYIVLRLRR